MSTLRVSSHAVARYMERIRPSLQVYAQARVELEALVEDGELTDVRPSWISPDSADLVGERATRWVVVDKCGIVMPVNHADIVVTVIGNAQVSPHVRAKRNDRRRRMKAARRLKNSSFARLPDSRPRDEWDRTG